MKRFLLSISCILSLLFLVTTLEAAHIIGGEITYECLGINASGNANRYKITMKIYRDCQGGGAQFDSAPGGAFPATVSIYQEGVNLPRLFELDAPIISRIEPSSDPCLQVPASICVEEGIYIFEAELPIINGSYHIVYQRCCRNGTISNIVSPGQTGATYTTEITAMAQRLCNDSPIFKDFPPIVLCLNRPLLVDQSATDAEGDSLVYELCDPLIGGGPNTNNAEALFGVAPNPDAPPPYDIVTFISPTYSTQLPLGAFTGVSINDSTGLITGIPNMQGQFVMAVCMSEYRDGELLSVTRRDFQLNVVECTPKVVAQVQADSSVTRSNKYFLRTCGTNKIAFTNESFIRSNILEYRWEFDLLGDTLRLNTWDAVVSFPEVGMYSGRLILNPNTTCGDTAFISIDVRPEIIADFDFEYDTCQASPVQFQDLSFSGSMQITNWEWTLGDGNTTSNQNPLHTYGEVGEWIVNLSVEDINECVADTTQILRYFPVPEEIIIDPSTFKGCNPQEVFFNNLSFPISDDYDILWEFGDGATSSEISPTHIYEASGIYNISLSIISPIGCQISVLYEDWIEVEPSPIAAFSFTPEKPTIRNPSISLNNESVNAISYFWEFNKDDISIIENPIYNFPDTGLQQITLTVTHESGCQDSLTKFVDIPPEIYIYIPNAFSPNGDDNNGEFNGVGILPGIRDYSLMIWDRWGGLLFSTEDPEIPWRGETQSNELAAQGVYIYKIEFTGPRGKRYQYAGDVTLLR